MRLVLLTDKDYHVQLALSIKISESLTNFIETFCIKLNDTRKPLVFSQEVASFYLLCSFIFTVIQLMIYNY